jgi:hypothetical protein
MPCTMDMPRFSLPTQRANPQSQFRKVEMRAVKQLSLSTIEMPAKWRASTVASTVARTVINVLILFVAYTWLYLRQ